MSMNYLFCFRTCCKKCHTENNQYKDHKYIIIKDFMEGKENGLSKMFNQTFIQVMKECDNNMNGFLEMFNMKIDKAMDEREEELRLPIEKIINQ